jgi:hypothetical protein
VAEAAQRDPMIRDARGRRVRPIDPVVLKVLHKRDVIDDETLRKISGEVGSGVQTRTGWLVWVFVIGGALCMLVMLIWIVDVALIQRAPGRLLDPKLVTITNLLFVGSLIWFGARRRRLARVKRVMLRHHHCPHCGYSLAGLPTEASDGTTLCPECGCAWRLGA